MELRRAASLSLQVLLFAVVLGCETQAQTWTLKRGTTPVIIVSVHGGTKPLAGAEKRNKRLSSDPHFTIKGDGRTANLATAIGKELRRLHPEYAKPTLLINRVHRRYLDLNRKREWSSHDPRARQYHDNFHSVLKSEVDRILTVHGWVLLIDVHGQSKFKDEVLIGTHEHKSVTEWSLKELWRKNGLVNSLIKAGLSVNPESPEGRQKFRGGFITQHYGQDHHVEAWQFEHGPDLRFSLTRRHLYVKTLAKTLVQVQAHRVLRFKQEDRPHHQQGD